MNIIQQLTGIALCPELANQITTHLDDLDYVMLHFVNKQLQQSIHHVACKKMLCHQAMHLGYINILKWIGDISWCKCDGGWNKNVANYIIARGYLDIVKWLGEIGFPLDEWTCTLASRYGRLDILKWLRENGCPWNEWTCIWAVTMKRLDILRWARDNGCPMPDEEMKRAAILGYTDNYPSSGRQIN